MIYDYSVQDAQGNDVPLSRYKGKVLLVVNTAPHKPPCSKQQSHE